MAEGVFPGNKGGRSLPLDVEESVHPRAAAVKKILEVAFKKLKTKRGVFVKLGVLHPLHEDNLAFPITAILLQILSQFALVLLC